MVEDADQVESDADKNADLQSQHETRDERRDPRYEVTLCQTDVSLSNKPVPRSEVKPLRHHWFVNIQVNKTNLNNFIPII